MNSIAWAIVFVALIYYERLYISGLKKHETTIGLITGFSLFMTFICTLMDIK